MVRGVVAKVVTRAMTTKMVKVLVLRIFACKPMFNTISSTKPLQLMSTPIVRDSRNISPLSHDAKVPPAIFAQNAIDVTPTTYAQVMPSFKSPRLVLRPDSAK